MQIGSCCSSAVPSPIYIVNAELQVICYPTDCSWFAVGCVVQEVMEEVMNCDSDREIELFSRLQPDRLKAN